MCSNGIKLLSIVKHTTLAVHACKTWTLYRKPTWNITVAIIVIIINKNTSVTLSFIFWGYGRNRLHWIYRVVVCNATYPSHTPTLDATGTGRILVPILMVLQMLQVHYMQELHLLVLRQYCLAYFSVLLDITDGSTTIINHYRKKYQFNWNWWINSIVYGLP